MSQSMTRPTTSKRNGAIAKASTMSTLHAAKRSNLRPRGEMAIANSFMTLLLSQHRRFLPARAKAQPTREGTFERVPGRYRATDDQRTCLGPRLCTFSLGEMLYRSSSQSELGKFE